MGNPHIPIVDHHAKIVGWCAIGTRDDEVIEFAIIERDRSFDHIDPASRTVLWAFEADNRFAICGNRRECFAGFGAPGTVITWFLTERAGALTHLVDFGRRAVAVIGRAFREHLGDNLAVSVHVLHLVERAFVWRQSQPCHPIQNGLDCLGRRAFQDGVFDTQNKRATKVSCVGPGKQGCACATQVKKTGG